MDTELKNAYIKKLNTRLLIDALNIYIFLMSLALLIIFNEALFIQIIAGTIAGLNLIDAISTTIVISKVMKNKVVIENNEE